MIISLPKEIKRNFNPGMIAYAAQRITGIGLVVYILFGVPPIARLLPVKLPATACAFFTSVILFAVISLLTNSRRLDCKRAEYADILR